MAVASRFLTVFSFRCFDDFMCVITCHFSRVNICNGMACLSLFYAADTSILP